MDGGPQTWQNFRCGVERSGAVALEERLDPNGVLLSVAPPAERRDVSPRPTGAARAEQVRRLGWRRAADEARLLAHPRGIVEAWYRAGELAPVRGLTTRGVTVWDRLTPLQRCALHASPCSPVAGTCRGSSKR